MRATASVTKVKHFTIVCPCPCIPTRVVGGWRWLEVRGSQRQNPTESELNPTEMSEERLLLIFELRSGSSPCTTEMMIKQNSGT